MKLCPNCKMITESHGECVVCGHCVVDEPHVEKKCEKYVLNKYFLPYLFKKHTFAVICFLIALTAAAISIKNIGVYALATVVVSTLPFVVSIFKNGILSWMENIYQEHFAEHKYHLGLYSLGASSILLSSVTVFVSLSAWVSTQEPVYL